MDARDQSSPTWSPIEAAMGAAMLAHVTTLAGLKLVRGAEADMLWISNVCLAITAVGLIIRSTRLLSLAFVAIAGLHTLWIFDAVVGVTGGRFPLGLTAYVLEADTLELLGTSHHLYLLPLLAVWLRRRGVDAKYALLSTVSMFSVLVITSRFFLPPHLNVNFAWALLPGGDRALLHWINAQPVWLFMPIQLLGASILFFLPGALVLARLGRAPATTAPESHPSPVLPATRRHARAFTLIELLAVIIVLAILSSIAIPKYYNYADDARDSATEGAAGGISTAMVSVFLDHQAQNAPSSAFITSAADIAGAMETGALPEGVTINAAGRLVFPNGDQYTVVAETRSEPARLQLFTGGGGGS